jgi:hypothetical protein
MALSVLLCNLCKQLVVRESLKRVDCVFACLDKKFFLHPVLLKVRSHTQQAIISTSLNFMLDLYPLPYC